MSQNVSDLFSIIWGTRTFSIRCATQNYLQAVSATSGRTEFLNDQNFSVAKTKPNRTNPRQYDKDLYKARHLIENFFATLKQYRAIATRYDKRAKNFLGAIYLAATVIWLN
jgi:transposase